MSVLNQSESKSSRRRRSEKTLADLAESTEHLIRTGDIDSVTSEKLAALSGYSVGGIFHHFKKIDYAFVHLYDYKREKKLLELKSLIQQHDPNDDITVLVNNFVNVVLKEVSKRRMNVLSYLIRSYLKRTENPEKYDEKTDILLDDLLLAAERDKTGTFANLDRDCLMLRLRAFLMAFRAPYFEGNSIAGTKKHISEVVKIGIILFGK